MKNISRIFLMLTFVFVAKSLLVAMPNENSVAPLLENAKKGNYIRIGVSGDVDTFNPLFIESKLGLQVADLLFLGLADLNDKSEWVPELATSWRHSADNLRITFYLRTDAVWADGTPITAADVLFTFELKRDKRVATPRMGETELIKEVIVENQHTVTFVFKEAYPEQMFDAASEVLPKHILENADRTALRGHNLGQQPLSSGSFKLKKWVNQQYIELVPNERYFGDRPLLDRVFFKIVPDETNLLMQLRTGQIDMLLDVPIKEIKNLKKSNRELAFHKISGRSYYYIGYNEANPLFSSAGVRRALTMALNRDKIIKALLDGYGTPCFGPIPPIIAWAYNENVDEIKYDVSAARSLLAQEGWHDRDGDGWLDKDGRQFAFSILTNTGNQIRSDLAVIVQGQFKKIGVKVEIRTAEWTAYLDQLRDSNLEAFLGGWGASFNVDPTPLFHSTAFELFNYVKYANPEIDKLIDAGRKEMDQAKAAKIWQEFQKKLYDDQPYTFLFWLEKIVAVNKRYANVNPIALSALYDIEKWYVIGNQADTE
ncbi:MAG: hypothetical protein DWQ05_05780 [Calditrichaeota bacterium]|nr:MAG: hypothetical protein DWQ05_05780 [Calditrichota bacterium]